jgi:hypothetical protein
LIESASEDYTILNKITSVIKKKEYTLINKHINKVKNFVAHKNNSQVIHATVEHKRHEETVARK